MPGTDHVAPESLSPDVGQLLLEVGRLPDPERNLLSQNERVLIEFCQRLGRALEEAVRPANADLINLLAKVLDEPLATLPGSEVDGPRPFELRLHHFRPDLTQRAAELLAAVGNYG